MILLEIDALHFDAIVTEPDLAVPVSSGMATLTNGVLGLVPLWT